jgi:Ala-tRNA(Pro) deacylase
MAIAAKLKDYLARQALEYALVPHPHSHNTLESAHAAHVSGKLIAKAVVLEDDEGYLMVVVPADHHVHLGHLHKQLGRSVRLVTEPQLKDLFHDCELGAIPPVGPAYGIEMILDDRLAGNAEVFFEAGDHESLVRVSGEQFRRLAGDAQVLRCSAEG